MSCSTNASRKRRRHVSSFTGNAGHHGDTTNNNLVDLPRIPGVPIEAIPLFLEALRVTTKFYQKQISSPYTIIDWEKRGDGTGVNHRFAGTNANNNDNTLHETIMNRLEVASAEQQQSSTEEIKERERGLKFCNVVEKWMEDVKNLARRRHQKSQNTAVGNHRSETEAEEMTNPQGEKEKQSVPFSFFMYLWKMQQEHERVTVRRSALFLSGLLLQKSKDCRSHLEQESNLAVWVSRIVAKGTIWKNSDRAVTELPLLQREAFALLSYLLDHGYGKLYPKLGVAATSLRHQCPNLQIVEVSTTTSMAEWRRLRDVALRYGPEEIRRIDRLVQKADTCLEILVPRIGVERVSTGEQDAQGDRLVVNKANDPDKNNESSGESDIDWEDGDGFEEGNLDWYVSVPAAQDSHTLAVDRTIAAMEASGHTILRGGELEIDFDQNVEDLDGDQAANQSRDIDIRKKLEIYIQKLSSRHLTRISAWLDGLRNADNLALQPGSASLVSLSSELMKLRINLIGQISESKQAILRAISSASRLNIVSRRDDTGSTNGLALSRTAPLGMGGNHGRFDHLLREKKRKRKQNNANRIQIKCRSR
jgi:hypothetical protein